MDEPSGTARGVIVFLTDYRQRATTSPLAQVSLPAQQFPAQRQPPPFAPARLPWTRRNAARDDDMCRQRTRPRTRTHHGHSYAPRDPSGVVKPHHHRHHARNRQPDTANAANATCPCTNSEIAGANATPNNLAKLDPKQTCCLLAAAPSTHTATETCDRGRAMQRLEGR
ncbi:hypothetical protein COCMIDRAFT_30637 [Bipolaris oryzae ATCC 44560]|uniref:Uncharacterized protein n=1 Tax=Bipolaris oryzae ATCC 44560 TaxID=930090 RepID=W6YXY0_COCMI|nr:uncharacterized protein COCMIDRAFT_30637 [Bipolaris oryzae ATCC 44560]EUC40414.1 hypothetical protein COCMIDRAFT_30637 [Bipolaris oryzae ATCC 44560]